MKQIMKRFLMYLVVFGMIITQLNSLSITVFAEESITSSVAEVQKYGNLTMDIKPSELYDAGFELGDMLLVTVDGTSLEIPFCTSYSDVDTGSLLVRDDKEDDIVVVAINMGDFATTYNVVAGDEITFSLLEKGSYLAEYLLRQLERTNIRADYALDSIFANFRSITTTGINPGVLYRSSSPINNVIGRAIYVDNLVEAVGVKTVINLADSAEEIAEYVALSDFESDYYMSLFDNNQIINLNMNVDIAGEDFSQKLVQGLRFLNESEGPYLIHCTEGKDRAGYVSGVLEALMGADIDEIIADYMTTYENFYGVEKGSEQYDAIANSNIIASMTTTVCGLEKGTDISDVDLSVAAKEYLVRIGMTEDEIEVLIAKLSVESIYKPLSVSGTVESIEKYGHTSTDILIEDFYNLGFETGDMVTAIFDNGFVVEAPFLDGYYVDNGNPLVRAYPGHTNIAVCINYGKLFEVADVEVGDNVVIMLTGAQDYLTQYEIRKLERTNEREDYSTDEVFANFRNISLGSIGKGTLYRSSSPINPELGRAAYADELISKVGINTIVNLADSFENITEYVASDDFSSPYYKGLYDNSKVITLNMGLAYTSDEFKASIIEGLIFMSENTGPYHFHCTEGKDRAGFFAALTESLMGASKDEIVEDYMISYINYYNIEKGSEKYNLITEDVLGMLKHIASTDNLDNKDLSVAATDYLIAGGMTTEQINMLKANLIVSNINEYEVVLGDTLWGIANENLGSGFRYNEIYELNKSIINNPNMIYVGQVLQMPY